jgi:TATA-box binding protein (TBP) (component of TFIID and TFIIIB)
VSIPTILPRRITESYKLSGRINLYDFNYEPEICNSAKLKRKNITFLIFATGKVIVTGIKSMKCIYNIVYPVIMELELCVKNKTST